MNENLVPDLDLYVAAALGKKAGDIVAMDVQGLTSIADAFVICSGSSNRQVRAIADHIERVLKDQSICPLSIEGKGEAHWVLMDYGHVIIHVFFDETRRFYDLEGLWRDAKRITTNSMQARPSSNDIPFEGEEIVVE